MRFVEPFTKGVYIQYVIVILHRNNNTK